MRLDRKTIGLLLASLIVIIAVAVFNSTAPATTTPQTTDSSPTTEPQLLFSDLNINTLRQLEIVEPETGVKTVLVRTTADQLNTSFAQPVDADAEAIPTPTPDPDASSDADDSPVWVISQASVLTNRITDHTQAESAVVVFSALTLTTQFEAEEVASFGLDAPRYRITATDDDGATFSLAVGIKNPTAPRYYVLRNDETGIIYQVPTDQVDSLINLLQNPPYVPAPTSTPLPTNTPNPYSEVQQTQTAEAAAIQQAQTEAAATFSSSNLVTTPTATP